MAKLPPNTGTSRRLALAVEVVEELLQLLIRIPHASQLLHRRQRLCSLRLACSSSVSWTRAGSVGSARRWTSRRRRKGAKPLPSVDELRDDGIFESDEELQEFLDDLDRSPPPRRPSGVDYVVYDTNIASSPSEVSCPPAWRRGSGRRPGLSFVTVGELEKWAEVRAWGARRAARWIGGSPAAGIDSDQRGLQHLGPARGGGPVARRPTRTTTLWVAACCLSQGLPLVTRNVKDFVAFAEHHGLILITD